jgi:hypothetical protein
MFDKLCGQWAIEKITYNGKDYKEDLYINFIVFEKDDKISIPGSVHFKKDSFSRWKIITEDNKNYKISIVCNDTVFKGLYNIKFIKDYDNKLLGIEMTSDSTFIRANKFFQTFEIDGKNW